MRPVLLRQRPTAAVMSINWHDRGGRLGSLPEDAKVVHYANTVTFRPGEVAVTRRLFDAIPRLNSPPPGLSLSAHLRNPFARPPSHSADQLADVAPLLKVVQSTCHLARC